MPSAVGIICDYNRSAGPERFSDLAFSLGGVGGGNILGSLLGAGTAAATSGGAGIGSILTQLIGGGVGGPVVTAIVALIRNAIAGRKPA